MPRPRSLAPRSAVANVRLTEQERAEMERLAFDSGHKTIAEYIRFLHRQFMQLGEAGSDELVSLADQFPKRLVRSFYKTPLGEIFWGDSRASGTNVKS